MPQVRRRLLVQARPHRRHGIPPSIVAVLAIPTVVGVYVRTADQHLAARRPAILAVGLVAISLAVNLVAGGAAVATHPSAYQPLDAHAFRTVTVPELGTPEPSKPSALGPAGTLVVSTGTSGHSAEAPALPVGMDAIGGRVTAPRTVAPRVVRFRPRPGQSGISRLAALSVRFTLPMDHASTRRAFTATVGKTSITGRYHWAEGDTVLVLVPDHALPFGAHVTLAVGSGARSAVGVGLAKNATARFSVAAKPTPAPKTPPPARPSTSGWRWPLIGPITQYFGQSLTKYGYHEGIDIDGQTGDPVRAARTGRVVVAGHYDSCGGLQVHIDHGNGLVSWYRHLSRIETHVGQRVTVGTVIGRVGATGCALGSHLHFAVRKGSTFVDPLRYLPRR